MSLHNQLEVSQDLQGVMQPSSEALERIYVVITPFLGNNHLARRTWPTEKVDDVHTAVTVIKMPSVLTASFFQCVVDIGDTTKGSLYYLILAFKRPNME